MKKGPRGPSTKREVLDRLIVLALQEPHLLGREIRDKLEEEFGFSETPGLRTVQQYMSNAREKARGNVQEQPWSLRTMAAGNTGIPWEAVSFLLKKFDELRRRQKAREKFWHWSGHPFDYIYEGTLRSVIDTIASGKEPEHVSVRPGTPRAPAGTVITNRQAKWLWRMHIILPKFDLLDLCDRADKYAYKELVAEYLGETFDTSDLDESLINALKSKKSA